MSWIETTAGKVKGAIVIGSAILAVGAAANQVTTDHHELHAHLDHHQYETDVENHAFYLKQIEKYKSIYGDDLIKSGYEEALGEYKFYLKKKEMLWKRIQKFEKDHE